LTPRSRRSTAVGGTIAIILPAREGFAPDRAGAIAMVSLRLAGTDPRTSVIGGKQTAQPFAGVRFTEISSTSAAGFSLGVLRSLRRLRPSVIEVHQQPRLARLIARLMPRSRVLLFLHNDPLTMRGLRRKAERAVTLRLLHRVVCVSTYLRDRYAAGLTETGKLAILPNPLSLADLPESPPDRRREILFAGRVVADKGVQDFLTACTAALPSLHGWSARIIGGDRFGPASPETDYVASMREAARAAGVAFDGPQPHSAVLAAMAAAAIVVVPSRWPEPFGLTALEAMASGAALIATGTGGLPELIGDAGILLVPGNPEDLTRAILKLAENEAERANFAALGRARAAGFDTPIIRERLAGLRAPD